MRTEDTTKWLQPMAEAIIGPHDRKVLVGISSLDETIDIVIMPGPDALGSVPHRVILYRHEEIDDCLPEADAPIRLSAIAKTLQRPSCDNAELQAFMEHEVTLFHDAKRRVRAERREAAGRATVICDRHGGRISGAFILRPSPTGLGQMRLCPACAEVHDTDPPLILERAFLNSTPRLMLTKGLIGPGTLIMVEDSVDDLRREASAHLTYIQAALHAITGDADFLIGNAEPETLLSRLELLAGKLREIAAKPAEPPAREPADRVPGPAGSRWS
jgi:hypothetical protein